MQVNCWFLQIGTWSLTECREHGQTTQISSLERMIRRREQSKLFGLRVLTALVTDVFDKSNHWPSERGLPLRFWAHPR